MLFKNFEKDGTDSCFEVIGFMSDNAFYEIEARFMNMGGVGIIPETEEKSSVWFDNRDHSDSKLVDIIEEISGEF